MYLQTLEIKNFRKISALTMSFSSGLNILLGENNIGKTTIVDALRTLLSGPDELYTRLGLEDVNDQTLQRITFRFVFKGLDIDQAALFMGATVLDADGSFSAEFLAEFDAPDRLGRLKARRYCGARNTTAMTAEMAEQLRSVYLPPLRDASRGLKPGARSLLARLLQSVSSAEGLQQCNQILAQVDQQLGASQPILATKAAISQRYNGMLGDVLTQQLDLNLSPQDIGKIAARLAILADGFDIERNGLGYNNLIYMAAVLGELSLAEEAVYRSLIIEEPKAHLHPQLQSILLSYFQQEVAHGGQQVQLFVTTHSPHFAALANLDDLIKLSEHHRVLTAFSVRNANLVARQKKKLERYLDITRADLFFARAVIMVEGAAERALVPAMAAHLNVSLRHLGVTVVSAEGLNFDCFLPLFGQNAMPVKVATITDRDPNAIPFPALGVHGDISNAALAIIAMDETFRKAFIGAKTLEYDIALQGPINRSLMLAALAEIHPVIARDLAAAVGLQLDNTEAARCLFQGMFERPLGSKNVSKAAFAQELAEKLRENPAGFVVPEHIHAAFSWIRVPAPPRALVVLPPPALAV
ncbi:AAA family ATPase [Janthinobacterium sp. PLB04]|uniref:AAA family ATPase n=1 Tax=Janthinobacterium lividum TaxID=29581 RepID=A0AAJ4MNK7_9BURK|nr:MULTISPECIES: AAA family ATPase [Janthinobacterium]KAB0325094.1 AAA family ATPase [Janthinobacterium lividum]QSX94183.1 AAA family ATPase [Janthinobacterium lividum]UGQ33951.1 AAA family ATPase [Janthinobacterium sp. PLB04]